MSNWKLDGCRDADGWLAREAMSPSSSGMAVSVSESAWSWSPIPQEWGRGPSDAGLYQ